MNPAAPGANLVWSSNRRGTPSKSSNQQNFSRPRTSPVTETRQSAGPSHSSQKSESCSDVNFSTTCLKDGLAAPSFRICDLTAGRKRRSDTIAYDTAKAHRRPWCVHAISFNPVGMKFNMLFGCRVTTLHFVFLCDDSPSPASCNRNSRRESNGARHGSLSMLIREAVVPVRQAETYGLLVPVSKVDLPWNASLIEAKSESKGARQLYA